MTIQKFEQIKSSIELAKTRRDRAEGAKQKIEESWKKEFGISTQEEVENKINELETEIESDKKERDKLMDKLDKMQDWDSL